MTRRLLALLILLLVPQLGIIYIESSGATLLWQRNFNGGVHVCTDAPHYADATDASHDCSSAADPVEGDGSFVFLGGGSGVTQTDWFDDWTGVSDSWIKVHIAIVELGISGSEILSFRNGAGGNEIGTLGYDIKYINPTGNQLAIFCDDTNVAWVGGYVSGVWAEWLIHVDLDNGDIDIWVDDFTGAPDKSCDGTGGDGATVFDGLRVEVEQADLWLLEDDIRIYDGDPR